MSADRRDTRESFLSRWSREKTTARQDRPQTATKTPQKHPRAATTAREEGQRPASKSGESVTTPAEPPALPLQSQGHAAAPAPDLPAIDALTLDSDFSGFFHPKVDEDLRRSALRKLFSDPHFNVMDGLDVYIDDYSKTEPIPAAMLAGMKQAQHILEWAAETPEAAVARRAAHDRGDPQPALDGPEPLADGDDPPAQPDETSQAHAASENTAKT